MPHSYHTVQSYQSVSRQGPDGKVRTATETYQAQDQNGKRRGKLYRERSQPTQRDSYTRHLQAPELDNLFTRPGSRSRIKNQVETRLVKAGARQRSSSSRDKMSDMREMRDWPGLPDPFRGFGFDEDFGSWFQQDPFFRDDH